MTPELVPTTPQRNFCSDVFSVRLRLPCSQLPRAGNRLSARLSPNPGTPRSARLSHFRRETTLIVTSHPAAGSPWSRGLWKGCLAVALHSPSRMCPTQEREKVCQTRLCPKKHVSAYSLTCLQTGSKARRKGDCALGCPWASVAVEDLPFSPSAPALLTTMVSSDTSRLESSHLTTLSFSEGESSVNLQEFTLRLGCEIHHLFLGNVLLHKHIEQWREETNFCNVQISAPSKDDRFTSQVPSFTWKRNSLQAYLHRKLVS